MFNLFSKKATAGKKVLFKLSGLHCSSCALSIDNALEEVAGVIEAKTNYAKAETIIYFDPQKTTEIALKKTIQATGYQVV